MTAYDYTKSRVTQWLGIILIVGVFAGAYWYFQVRASTLNSSRNGVVTTGLVGLWSFDGADISSGTTATDRSGQGNNGTLHNSPTATQGKIGQALSFNGSNQSVHAPQSSSLNTMTTVTVSAWVKTTNPSANAVIVRKNNNTGVTNHDLYQLGLNASHFYFTAAANASGIKSDTGNVTVAANTWYYVMGIYDGANVRLYVNGVADGTPTALTGTISTGASLSLGIGVDYEDSAGYFPGALDDVRIYNRALSATEIQSLYIEGGGTKVNTSISQPQGTGRLDSGLSAYFKMDDGSGTTPLDSSTKGANGTFSGSPTWTTGQIGGALNFTGTESVTTGTLSIDRGTISAWVAPDASQFGVNNSYDVFGTTGSGFTFDLYHFLFNGSGAQEQLAFDVRGSFGATISCHSATITTVVSTAWKFYTVTWDINKGCAVYINAVSDVGLFPGTTGSTGARAYSIAGPGGHSGWKGKIDELRVYDRVLSADEITQIYNLTNPTYVDSSLKGYWSFDGQDMAGTTAYDQSGAGHTGTLTNSPTVVEGKVGQALNFNGVNSQVNVGTFTPPASTTFSAWIYPRSAGGGGAGRIFSSGESTGLLIGMTSSSAFVFSPTGAFYNCITPGLTLNTWQMISATFTNGGTCLLYINGVQVFSTSASIGTLAGGNTAIGGRPSNSVSFDGMIDEVRVYSRILSASEIAALYAQGGGVKMSTSISQSQGTGRLDSGLAGYWKLDDGTSGATPTTAADSSNGGHNGTLTNGPTWTTGQIGQGLSFVQASNTYVTTAATIAALNSGNHTICAWIKPSSVTGNHWIAQQWAVAGLGPALFTIGAGIGYEVGGDRVETASGLAINTWTHVCASITGTVLTIYKDGTMGVSASKTIGTNSGTSFVVGGPDALGAVPAFSGVIDEVRIYNRALSADEVSQLYRLTTPTGTDTSLKGYWSFNGTDIAGTTAYDRSGVGNNGTLTGGPTVTEGKIGQALSFDGSNDYVDVANESNFDFERTQAFSLSLWVKPDTSLATVQMLITKQVQGSSFRGWSFSKDYGGGVNDAGKLDFGVSNTGGSNSLEVYTTSDTNINNGLWHHYAVTYDGSSTPGGVKIYEDGASLALSTYSNTLSATALNNVTLQLGERNGSSGQTYKGKMDEVRVYNRVLSASEIAALYNQGR